MRRKNGSHQFLAVEWGMRVLLSIALLACAFCVILSRNYGAVEQRWAFAAVGAVVAYWFKR